jgi:hypothetical protein
MIACALLAAAATAAAESAKPPLSGLVSMGAYKFVVHATDPDNTLEYLNAKPGIFGGIVVLASWRELQPSRRRKFPRTTPSTKRSSRYGRTTNGILGSYRASS